MNYIDAPVQEANVNTIPTIAVETTRLVYAGDLLLDNAAAEKYVFYSEYRHYFLYTRKIPIHLLTSGLIISTVTKDTSSAAKSLVKTFRH